MQSPRLHLGRALAILVGLTISYGAAGQTPLRRTRPPLDILEDRTPRPTPLPARTPVPQSAWVAFGSRNATDVAVGANGVVWIIGNDPAGAADKNIYRWDGNAFQQMVGQAVRIAVDPNGKAWVVNSSGSIFQWIETSWQNMPGKAIDIGIGANGAVWVLDMNGSPFKWDGSNWQQIGGGATRIAVDPSGNPWVVNAGGQIWHWKGTSYDLLPGSAKDITVGPDGAVLIVSTTPASGGFQVQRWRDGQWVAETDATGAAVAVGPAGALYVMKDTGALLRRSGGAAAPALQAGTIVITGPALGSITTSGVPVTSSGTIGSTGGTTPSITGGTLVTGTGGVPVSSQPLVVTGLAPRYEPGSLTRGTLLCPIIGAGEKLVKGCIDLFGGGSLRGKTDGPATYLGPAKSDACPSGFRDDGDYCAKPAAYGRGAGYAWQFGDAAFSSSGQWSRCQQDNPQGCEQPGGGITLVYPKCRSGYHAFGTNVCSPDCPPGWEDIGVSCHKPNTRGNCGAYGRVAGLGYAFGDPRNGGECWACPVLMHRSMAAVNSTDPVFPACTAGTDDGIMWQSAQFPEPGVAAFVRHADIVKLAFNDRAYVDAFLTKRAAGNATKKQQLWDQMINAPNDSPEFKALIFTAILTTARQDPNLTSNASQSVSYFQDYIRKRRTYVAQDAVDMYNAYLGFNSYKQWKGAKAVALAGGPMGFISAGTGAVITSPSASLGATVGVPPDDYVNAAYAAAVPDSRGQEFVKALNDLAGTNYTNPSPGTASLDPTAAMQLGLNVAGSAKAFYDLLVTMKVASEIAAIGGRVGIGLDLGMCLGGNVLDAVGAVMSVYAQQEAATQYAKLVSEADKPVSIATILTSGSDDDKNSLIMWWALATSAYKPSTLVRQSPMQNSEVCAGSASQCAVISSVVRAARP